MYEKSVKKRLNEYRAKTTRQKYAKKVSYQEFRQHIHVCRSPFILFIWILNYLTGSTAPKIGYSPNHRVHSERFVSHSEVEHAWLIALSEDGDESDDDDDLEVGGVTQDYKCPISLTTLVKPMTS